MIPPKNIIIVTHIHAPVQWMRVMPQETEGEGERQERNEGEDVIHASSVLMTCVPSLGKYECCH